MNNDRPKSGTPIYGLADQAYDRCVEIAIRRTPKDLTDPQAREIWQTEFIDRAMDEGFNPELTKRTRLGKLIWSYASTISTDERQSMKELMHDWNHEHETDPEVTYVLNPDYRG